MKNSMRTIYALIIWVGLMVLCSECDNLTTFVVSKAIAVVIMTVAGKLLAKSMTEEELNEEV